MRNIIRKKLAKLPLAMLAIASILLFAGSKDAVASTEVWPSAFNAPITGGGVYCLNAPANALTVAWSNQSCSTGNSGTDYDLIVINWYENTSLSNTGGTLVQTTSTSSSSVSDSYTPSTASYGTTYYYVVVTWTGGNYCSPLTGNITTTVAQMDSVVVTPLSVTSVTVLANACNSSSNGNAQANIVGCSPPFTYSWTDASSTVVSTSNPSGPVLSAGTYTFSVTDGNSLTATNSVTITSLAASWYRTTNVTCFGAANGTATPQIISGGTPPYTYAWASTPSSTIITTPNHSALNLAPGYTYTLTISDANGCSASLTTTVTQPATAVAETVTLNSQPTCHGYHNAVATANPSGGTPGYNFVWSDGETTQQATALDATTVSCETIDANGCKILKSLVIGQPANVSGTFSNKVQPLCNGGNGSMTVAGTGGTGAYTYSWAPVGGTGTVANNIPAQTYTVTIHDNNGCAGSATAALLQPAVLANTITRTTCVNGKSTLSAHPTGGTSPYTYAWSNSTTRASIIVPPGTYSVSVTDNHSCNVATTYSFAACPVIKPRDGEAAGDNNDKTSSDITIYPNPTSDQFTIAGLEQGMTIEMYDYTGRKISSQIIIDNYPLLINIGSQPNGIYLIRILDKDGNLVGQKKVVKTN